ncbi:HutD/Ves family protein [Bifidobacterium tibiigranuli]|uniref:HutD/Ves family protein n=1 Tax=Bifidobacterium tibiigranuli TaxID=2172043 RepID=UPI0026F20C49|nr:HutD family protein [Bifidobacterium tibiigranuli]MCI1223706.1 HutD family protein [Bifidobacterium subtile]MCI2184773.1 HutD family protein [Bifidobacterium tibiigranuli]MCI2204539.1 HutD family protein [Bifidobacterium tibiigranuli]
MTTTVLHHDDYAQSRWKNGLGVTRTVDIAPESADFDTFAWRVSMADVGDPTPFSPLPGVDRWLMPIAGSGFELTINGASYRPARGEVVRFSGDDEAAGGASGSGSRDLNLMVRRPTPLPTCAHLRLQQTHHSPPARLRRMAVPCWLSCSTAMPRSPVPSCPHSTPYASARMRAKPLRPPQAACSPSSRWQAASASVASAESTVSAD